MKKWVVKFDNIKVVHVLEELGILSYKPLFHEKLKFVFVETNITKEEILKIEGVVSCRESRIGSVWV